MTYQKGEFIYEGKAKKLFSVQSEPELIWFEFKNSLTAYNALKKGELEGKGSINLSVASLIFKYLEKNNIHTHHVQQINETEWVAQKADIIPLEVVVRNRAAGSLCKRFAVEEGSTLKNKLIEFYYKDDELQDPMITEDQAVSLGFVKDHQIIDQLRDSADKINNLLIKFFDKCGIELIDFKLEFGFNSKNEIILADEITPDSCRLWDKSTGQRFDKDLFRRDLGDVKAGYSEALNRIEKVWRDKI